MVDQHDGLSIGIGVKGLKRICCLPWPDSHSCAWARRVAERGKKASGVRAPLDVKTSVLTSNGALTPTPSDVESLRNGLPNVRVTVH